MNVPVGLPLPSDHSSLVGPLLRMVIRLLYRDEMAKLCDRRGEETPSASTREDALAAAIDTVIRDLPDETADLWRHDKTRIVAELLALPARAN